MNDNGELIVGIKTKNIARVRRAIANGASLKQLDEFGRSLLVMAMGYEQLDIMRELCTAESINLTDADGQTALSYAVCLRKTEIVNVLLAQEGIDVNVAEVHEGKTPLLDAARRGYLEIVEVLLRVSNIDVNLANERGETPLYFAAQWRHLEVVNALLGAGADVNKMNIDGITPLVAAVMTERENYEIVRLLLLHGADLTAQTNTLTPLRIFALGGYVPRIACLFIADGANLYESNEPHELIVESVFKKKRGEHSHISPEEIDAALFLYVALDNYQLSMQSIQRIEDELGKQDQLIVLRDKLNDEEIVTDMKKQLLAEKLKWVMHEFKGQDRIVDVVVAMKPMGLPTLVIVEMLMFDNPRLVEIPFHVIWNLVERIIRFKIHKE